MQTFTVKPARLLKLFLLIATMGLGTVSMAQPPASLNYPNPSAFIANVTNVFLSPNLSGSATSYSITPGLPAGLSFNTNTGVISGVPTAASPVTTYTITAFGSVPTEFDTTTIDIQVTNNYFNNNYAQISFGGPTVTVINGSTGATISNTATTTYGRNAGDVVVYQNVAVLSGQSIDCIVKTVSVSSSSTFAAYDQTALSGTGYNNNDPKFFSPQLSFPANNVTNTAGGNVQFNFQYILGGTYNTATQSGLPVVLQNVRINTYDVDGNDQNYSNQFNEFGGFSTSELGSGTTIDTPVVFNATTGLTTFRSSTQSNNMSVTADPTRIRVTYENMSDFSIRMGGGGTAYFFLDFSAGPAFATAVPKTTPSIDLNNNVIGIGNTNAGCGTGLSFTQPSDTNIAGVGNLTQLRVSFPTAQILNGASEQIVVDGASNGTIALNSNPSINNLQLSGVTYSVAGSVTSGVRTLVFTSNGGNFTVANAEALLDALQYSNIAATPTSGDRQFTISVRNTSFESPKAVFTASLNCVSISGNIYHDINGMVDDSVNASNATQFAAGFAYAVRVDPVTNQVIDVKPIDAGGSYNFGTVTPGSYAIYVSNSAPAVGSTFTAATYPSGYVSTAEHLGADAGTDLLTDGKILLTVGSESITDANFGLQIPPTTSNNTINDIANPGGFNNYSLPSNTFPVSDLDGTIDSIVINSFPTGANYLKIGSTVYTAPTGVCPPQFVPCTPWPGSVVVPFSGNNPVPSISVDPEQEGNTDVVINFTAYDNARALSNASDVTLNFVGDTTYHDINGRVWNDANGDGAQDGLEALVATADAGHTLFAILVQHSNTYSGEGTLFAVSPVTALTGYNFTNVPAGNDYSIHIVSLPTAPVIGAAASTVVPYLAPGWIAVSTNANGSPVAGLNTNDPAHVINNLNASYNNMDFGIERLPESTPSSTTVPYPSVGTVFTLSGAGSNPPVPSGTDVEDGLLGAGKTIVITSLPTHTTLLYNDIPVTVNQVITNFDPSLLKIQVTPTTVGETGTSFTFAYRDAASVQDLTPATYNLDWGTPLPVTMGAFMVSKEDNKAKLKWETYAETNNKGFAVERSTDSRNWIQIGFVASAATGGNSNGKLDYVTYDNHPLAGTNYYRLKQVDLDGKSTYTEVRQVSFNQDNTISIYPNPATDVIYINLADWKNVTEVRMFDIKGRMVFQAKEAGNGISLAKMANGTYLLQIEQANGQTSDFKLIKR